MDTYTHIVAWGLIVFMFVNIFASWKLWTFAKDSQYKYPALNERFFSAGVKTVGSLLLAPLGFNRIFEWHWDSDIVVGVLLLAVMLHSLPPVVWLYYYATGKFNRTLNDLGIGEN